MEYHVLGWTGSPSEDLLSISNVSTQSLVRLPKYRSSHCHDIHLSTSKLRSLQWTTHDANSIPLMQDYPAHPQIHPVDHARPPVLYDKPWQPSVYMMAYLGTCTHLTHGQTVSSPIAS